MPFYLSIESTTDNSSHSNISDRFKVCNFIDTTSQDIISYMDLVNRAVVPFLLMIVFTVVLIDFIFKSRKKIQHQQQSKDNNRLKKDIRFAVTSVALNVIFFFFSLPTSVLPFFPAYNSDIPFSLCLYLFYAGFGCNFYILFFTNSIVKNETLMLLNLKRYFKGFRPTSFS